MSQSTKQRLGERRWIHALSLVLAGTGSAFSVGNPATNPARHGEPAQASAPEELVVRVALFDPAGDKETLSAGAHVWASCVLDRGVYGNPFLLPLGEVLSDERGQARFDLAPLAALPVLDRELCQLVVRAHRDGFDADVVYLRLHELAELEECEVILLRPGDERLGRVRNKLGEPVAGARAYFEQWDASASVWEELDSDVCDEMGYFTWQASGTSLRRVIAEHGDWGAADLELPDESELLELVLNPVLPALTGRVVSANGEPLPGRRLTGASESRRWVDFITDELGEFRYLPGLEGKWILDLDTEVSRAPSPEPVSVVPGSDPLTIRDGGAFLLVKTMDAEGRPLNSMPPEAFLVREELARGRSNLRDPRLSSSAIFPVDSSYFAQRVTNGLWLIELPGAGEYFVELAASLPRGGCVDALKRLVVEEGEVKRASLTAQRMAKTPPLELEVLDVDGESVADWQAVLSDARTGRFVESFGSQGVANVYCLGDPTYREPVFPPGEYELSLWPVEGSYMLPVRVTLELQSTQAAPTQVRFAGNGGLVHVIPGDAVRNSGERALNIVFHSAQTSQPGTAPAPEHLRLYGSSSDGDDPVVLLAPGDWRWQLLTPAGEVLDSGECSVQARGDLRLAL